MPFVFYLHQGGFRQKCWCVDRLDLQTPFSSPVTSGHVSHAAVRYTYSIKGQWPQLLAHLFCANSKMSEEFQHRIYLEKEELTAQPLMFEKIFESAVN